MNLYMTIYDNVIMDVRYLCSCDPVANVAVEAMCGLAQGKTLGAAKVMGKEDLYRVIGSSSGVIPRKVWGVLELLNQVIKRYESGNTSTEEFEAAEWD